MAVPPGCCRPLPLVFLAGSGALLLVAIAPVGSVAAVHSWEQPARVVLATAVSTATLPCVHSDSSVKTRGTGLYYDLPLRLILDGVKAAPRARRKPDPTGVGTSMRTLPLPEDTEDDNANGAAGAFANALYDLRGVDGQLGGGQTAVRVYRLMPNRSTTSASTNSG